MPLAGSRWGLLQLAVGSLPLPPHPEMEGKFAGRFQGGMLLGHALNPVLPGSPEGPWPEAERASMPWGAGGHGGWILGANWVLGKCMAYQVPGRAQTGRWVRQTFSMAAVPPPASPASLDFGLSARW